MEVSRIGCTVRAVYGKSTYQIEISQEDIHLVGSCENVLVCDLKVPSQLHSLIYCEH